MLPNLNYTLTNQIIPAQWLKNNFDMLFFKELQCQMFAVKIHLAIIRIIFMYYLIYIIIKNYVTYMSIMK